MLRKNLKDIEDLILNKRFVPFPPRPKAYQLDLNSDPHIHQQPIPEEYPSKDGFENNRRLTRTSHSIPTNPHRLVEIVISRLAELINLGFSLKDNVIIDALHMFEHRLDEIGDGTLSLQFDQLNVIARGIFIVPDLVNLWKQIGYYEICNDVNDLETSFLAIRFGENVYSLVHLPSNARAAEITIITATNTKKQSGFTKIFLDKENYMRFRVEK
ncbi:hypothetical protein RhiirB3_529030 [Rhizophagus irregularis]|nr:hypothetical protein RhiirB3_529030 [Rhizophagus irregularis]